MYPVNVYAKERGRAPASLPRSNRIRKVVSYDIVSLPSTPLRIGLRVAVFTLKKWRNPDGTLSTQYAAEAAGVEGEIVGIRTMELAVTELIVSNKNVRSTIGSAYLSIQHVEGSTVSLELWRKALRVISLPFLPHTRHVPLEKGEIVADRPQADGDDED